MGQGGWNEAGALESQRAGFVAAQAGAADVYMDHRRGGAV